MKVAILDYGAGNLHSLAKALARSDVEVEVTTEPRAALACAALVLPGVGAFGSAMERLAPARDELRAALRDGFPCLGICLGMQLLFDASDEGDGAGLGVIAGRVERLRARRVPQMGWNVVQPVPERRDPVIRTTMHAYFANSFVCRPVDERVVSAWSQHEDDKFAAAVRVGRTLGVQFHPEKSGPAGVRMMERWLSESRVAPEQEQFDLAKTGRAASSARETP
jgi:imidazole glycerol-phosphate synthase subunit HisH